MSFLQPFADDVFISYASLDDEPLLEGQKGWVTNLHRDLEKRVSQLLGESPTIWRDDRELRGNSVLDPTICKELRKAALLLSVVSPRYIQSDWCLKEFRVFCEAAEETGGVHVADQSRIFKVIKTPVERRALPAAMQEVLNYEFYEIEDSGRPPHRHREYSREFGEEAIRKYVWKLDDLAQDIAHFLRLLSGQFKPVAPRATIYLAEVTSDLRELRDEMRRDLIQRGFAVLPDRVLSQDSEFKDQVSGFLARSAMSIHLIGDRYGMIPETETQSNIALQAELAIKGTADPSFLRVIWMPVNLQPVDERQKKLVEFLKTDANGQHRTEVLETKIEDLKTFVEDWAGAQRHTERPATRSGPLRVYIIADPADVEAGAVMPLENALYDRGFEPVVSAPGADEAETRALHVENYRLCDACIVYYGKPTESWLRAKMNELRKFLDSRTDPPLARAVYLASPDSPHKRNFRTREALVIQGLDGFSADALAPFVKALRGATEPA